MTNEIEILQAELAALRREFEEYAYRAEKEVDSSLAEHDILKKGQQYRMLLLAKSAMSRDLTPTVKLKAVVVNSLGQQVNITVTSAT